MELKWLKALRMVEAMVHVKAREEREEGPRMAYTIALSVLWALMNEVEADLVSDLSGRAKEEAPPRADTPLVVGEQERREANGGAD